MRASILLMLITVFFGCNSNLKFEEFVGMWQNSDEGFAIELKEDSTFKAINIPLDVENDYYLTFSNSNNQYLTNSNGYISDVDLPNTLMYKANQQWVQKLIDDGYEIIDIGYPVGENLDPSLFYTMELNLIFP